MWKDSANCSILNFSRNYVNLLVEDESKGGWRLTCYYGYPERTCRREAWDMLRDLRNMSDVPWCVIEDFNDLLSQHDKVGIHQHPNWLCTGFREAVSDCNLLDVPLEGHPFTWIKSRGTEHVIEERLDRALVSQDWWDNFPDVKLLNLLASHSDHRPILLQCDPIHRNSAKKYCFRFENVWLKDDELIDVVNRGWNAGTNNEVLHRISNCAAELSS
ncbi:uncharacterized protein LOC131649724 [Vicia villosa]|uniref:uncharacterized protein LOC131649724 n=1 Tax=Vicia villosa TaxID=3911 RepID=UPI00273C98F2|nr:uncharacterized protein LOC131649724 [Vicia villosa]